VSPLRALLLWSMVVLAGVTGAVLTLAGVESPATGPLTLVFVLAVPAICVGLLLGGLDVTARLIVSASASLVLAASIAEIMLVTSGWSPDGGIVATAIVSALLAAAALILRRHSRPTRPEPVPDGEPALDT
jgi:hypothetical protein